MKKLSLLLLVAVIAALVTSCACPTPTPKPTEAPPTEAPPTEAPPTEAPPVTGEFKVVVVGKSVHPYWSNVEKGVIAAGEDLGLSADQAIFFVPPTEDVAKQIETMETYIAQGVTGIAVAPSDPAALEPVMKKAADAGIIVTTLDTPPVDDSVSLVYIGTDNYSAGMTAGEAMKALITSGTVGIGRGSDTALNALQRTDGFLEAIAGTDLEALEPVNDKEDAARALELANSVLSANPDLAGAFGVYAYNGPAWATAIKEAGRVGKTRLVCFDATTDIINGIKEGVIDATVAQREFDMGYKSVELIHKIHNDGQDAAFADMGVVDGIIDTGVDVITPANLKDYEAALDAKGIPHEWTTEGWEPVAAPAVPEGFAVVVIGKSVHPYWSNVEKGVIAAGGDLGLSADQAIFFVPPTEDVAKQIETMETYIAQGVTGIAVAPSDPAALEPVMKKAADAGIIVTTLDTPPVDDSVSLVYIGTDNYSAGMTAGEAMVTLLPDGGTVGIGRGSDTALNALQRTDGFLEATAGTDLEALEPVNDKEDAARALELANSVLSANPDLAGAFGVYAYNGPAWATAIKEANRVDETNLVCFDATTDIINGIKEGVIDATVAQREFDMGYKSVQLILLIATKGEDAAMSEMGVVDGIIDTGVDVITQANLKDYEAALDAKGIPHEWDTTGWEAEADEVAQWE
jgi:ribose transport system substrate-binding protein